MSATVIPIPIVVRSGPPSPPSREGDAFNIIMSVPASVISLLALLTALFLLKGAWNAAFNKCKYHREPILSFPLIFLSMFFLMGAIMGAALCYQAWFGPRYNEVSNVK